MPRPKASDLAGLSIVRHRMKSILAIAFVLSSTVALAAPESPIENGGLTQKQAAVTAAVADSLTTHLALQAGAIETNPLINTSAGGLVVLAGLKWALVEYVDSSDFLDSQKSNFKRATTAVWGGAAINNLLLALSASNPVSLLAGVVGGIWLWNQDLDEKIEDKPGASRVYTH